MCLVLNQREVFFFFLAKAISSWIHGITFVTDIS